MWKKHKKTLLLTSLLILLPMVVGLLLWNRLPEQLPTHWGPDGAADGWGNRAKAVFAMPLFLLGIHWVCVMMTAVDPKNRNQNHKPITLVLWICPLMSMLVGGATYLGALGYTFNMNLFVLPTLGLLFVIIGNYLPKCRPNYTIGIKLPWTLNDEENWNRTHRFAGRLWIIGGILMMAAAFLPSSWMVGAVIALLLLLSLVPTVYSYLFYRRHGEAEAADSGEEIE